MDTRCLIVACLFEDRKWAVHWRKRRKKSYYRYPACESSKSMSDSSIGQVSVGGGHGVCLSNDLTGRRYKLSVLNKISYQRVEGPKR